MRDLTDHLEELLAQTDTPHKEVRSIIREIETQWELLQLMQSFIESEYRGEFEDTLSYEDQERYRNFFELDT